MSFDEHRLQMPAALRQRGGEEMGPFEREVRPCVRQTHLIDGVWRKPRKAPKRNKPVLVIALCLGRWNGICFEIVFRTVSVPPD